MVRVQSIYYVKYFRCRVSSTTRKRYVAASKVLPSIFCSHYGKEEHHIQHEKAHSPLEVDKKTTSREPQRARKPHITRGKPQTPRKPQKKTKQTENKKKKTKTRRKP